MKNKRPLVLSLVFVAALVLTAVGLYATGTRPLLGLDLEGGLSVVLQAPKGTDPGVMQQTLERIRSRVDALGVAEPDISLVGGTLIQVQLPGLGGQGHVLKQGNQWCAYSSQNRKLGCFAQRAQADAQAKSQSVQRVLDIIGTTARLEERQTMSVIGPSDPAYSTTAFSPGVIKSNDPYRSNKNFKQAPAAGGGLVTFLDANGNGFFDPGQDQIYTLGPIVITGADLKKATPQFITSSTSASTAQTGWQVAFTLTGSGTSKFSDATTRLVSQPAPQNELAIVIDNVVISSPTVQTAITGGQGVITFGSTANTTAGENEAKNLAVVLNSGALPVELARQEVQTVSPLLGKESLRQGIVAGLAGLVALMLYLAFYYRMLGVVTWFGMGIWAILAIGIVSVAGQIGYALTLAGVAGIIVSLGITDDSYIVFYERLKDEVRHGKSLRAAVQPAFKRSWRTIVAADIVTIIAALVLYLLAVGSVRGFALTLGISTALDMFVVYFFKRPLVFLMARSERLTQLRGFGLRSGVAADDVAHPGAAVPAPVGGAR